jgi:(p)ppGpp synthase/HD superfamily hydrolase
VDLLEERLAKLWMTGFRKSIPPGGSPRSAWAHPQDVVRLIQEEFIVCKPDAIVTDYLIRVAWIHDILEDGYLRGGTLVTEEDLLFQGVDAQIVKDVVEISRSPEESKEEYLARLIYASPRVKLLKCIDRTCNLRESPKQDHSWWDKYSASTRKYVLPLAVSLPSSEGWDVWATSILEHAMTLRPSRRINQVTL